MMKQVIEKTKTEVGSLSQDEVSHSFSLFRNKYIAAMRRAEELLNAPNMDAPNIHDSLNCGKFNAKFVNFLKEMLCII